MRVVGYTRGSAKRMWKPSLSRLFPRSIRGRIVLLMLVLLIPILIIQGYLYYDVYQDRRRQELLANLEMARAVGKVFEAYIKDVLRQELAIGLAATSSPPLSSQSLKRLLEKSAKDYAAVQRISWFDASGNALVSSLPIAPGFSITDREYFQEIKAGRDSVVSDLIMTKTEQLPSFSIARAMRDDKGLLLGIVVAIVDPERLDAALAVERPKQGAISIIDRNGMLVYRYPHISQTWEQRKWVEALPILKKTFDGEELKFIDVPQYEKFSRIIAAVPIRSIGWIAGAGRREEEALQPVVSSIIRDGIAFVSVCLLAFLAALGIARTIALPVKKLQAHTRLLREGDLDARIKEEGPSELEDLSRTLNDMAGQLQTDLTQREQTEEALRESETRFRTLADAALEGVVITEQGRIVDANEQYLQIMGGTRSELIEQDVASLIVPEDRDRVMASILAGKPSHTEHRMFRRDGTPIVVETHGRTIAYQGRQVRITAIRDITQSKQGERQLFEVNQRLQALMEALPVGVSFSGDTTCQHITGNPAVLAQFEVGQEDNLSASAPDPEASGRQVRFFRDGQEISDVDLPLQRAVAENRAIPPMELEIELRSGRRWFADVSGAPIPDREGNVIGGVAVTVDVTDRKRAEEALRKNLERLDIISSTASQLLMSNEPQKIVEALCRRVMEHLDCHAFFNFLVDEERNCLRLNAYAGIPEETARKIHFLDFGVAVCGCAARDACRIIAENIPTTPDIRTELVKSFGITAYACHPLFAQGRVIGTLSFGTKSRLTFTDDELSLMKTVADQVATAMERIRLLQASEERAGELEARVKRRTAQLGRQAALLDLARDAIIVRTIDGKIGFWSSGAEATYGFTREEAFGKTIDTLLRTEFPLPLEEIMDIVQRERRWEGELIHTRKDGQQIIALGRWSLREGAAGGPPEILEINRDISERKQTEQLLRRASAYNRSLLETSLDPLVTIDPAGRISDLNAATERVTGYPRERLIGTDFSDYFTDPARARAGYTQVFAEGFVRDYRLEIRHRDGHVTPVLYNASVYKGEAGTVLGIFAAARDITEQLRLEDRLRQSQKMEAIGTLAGGIAHDFNNVLAAIMGFTEMAIEDVADQPDVHHMMDRVLKAAFRGRDLVRQILAFSRKTEGERKEISLTPLVKETHALLRSSLPSTIRMPLAITTNDDCVRGDPTQLQQVLMNLATNAAYALRENGGQLTIGVSSVTFFPGSSFPDPEMEPGTYVQLTVQDTGTGMTEEVRQRAFEPFFTTKEQGKGTGMGLAVVYGIVKSHRGAVTVQSQVGQGSVFSVFLPQVQRQAERKEGVTTPLPTGSERILFVDDEELLVETFGRVLQNLGYTVTVAQHGAEAWNLFIQDPWHFDLVITDQTMPDVTGISLAQEMIEMRRGLPVILCTGYSELVSAEKAREAGISAFVMKPVTKKELAETIRLVLDKQTG